MAARKKSSRKRAARKATAGARKSARGKKSRRQEVGAQEERPQEGHAAQEARARSRAQARAARRPAGRRRRERRRAWRRSEPPPRRRRALRNGCASAAGGPSAAATAARARCRAPFAPSAPGNRPAVARSGHRRGVVWVAPNLAADSPPRDLTPPASAGRRRRDGARRSASSRTTTSTPGVRRVARAGGLRVGDTIHCAGTRRTSTSASIGSNATTSRSRRPGSAKRWGCRSASACERTTPCTIGRLAGAGGRPRRPRSEAKPSEAWAAAKGSKASEGGPLHGRGRARSRRLRARWLASDYLVSGFWRRCRRP